MNAHGGDHGVVMDEAFWDNRYRSGSGGQGGRPSPHLASEVAGLAPGSALDAGCGLGGNAIWLAEQGWRVTAVDVSAVALEQAATRVAEVGADLAARITWLHADATDWLPPLAAFDLVTAQFVHLAHDSDVESFHRRLAAAVASGGTLLIVGHDRSEMENAAPRSADPGVYSASGDVAALLDPREWEIQVSEIREGQANPGHGAATSRDAVLRAQRRG